MTTPRIRESKRVNTFLSSAVQPFLRVLAAVAAVAGLAACGGGVGPAQSVPNQAVIVILPASTATAPVVAYAGLPTTFSITGGNGSYIVASSNQAAIPSPGSFAGSSFTIVPNPVTTETTVTLTARDTSTAATVTATVTVRAGTINNEITITPTSTQGGSCSPAICSGGDALVSVTLSQGGIPLAARGVRFDATSGDYRFIITSPTGVETLESSATVVTDETGRARARLRVNAGANNQTALLRVTDLGSLSFQQTTFTIAQATGSSPGFFALPEGVTFTGPRVDQCARNVSSNFFVYGGRPPYTISNTSSAFTVSPTIVSAAGGSFTVIAQGGCVDPGLPIGITDSSGRNISVTVANKLGTAEVPALVVAPETITLSDCDTVANVTVAGGTGNYLQPASGSGSVIASIFGNTVAVRRLNPSGPATSPVSIGVSDGISVKTVTLTLTGRALSACPSVGLTASPSTVTLSDCTSATSVAISGGSGPPYTVTSLVGVDATMSGGTLTIRRTAGSSAFAGGTLTVSDSTSSSVAITVNATGAGAGACTSSTPLTASPNSVTLTDCSVVQNVALSGGSGTYTAVSGNSSVLATVSGKVLSIRRASPSAAFAGGTVTVSDGSSSIAITVNASGAGSGTCPASAVLTANPTTVTLTDCTTPRSVTLSGGTGSYSFSTSSSSIVANIAGSTLQIQRATPSNAIASGTVTVSDGVTSVNISVVTAGAGAAACSIAPTPLAANPNSVSLSDCNTGQTVTITGGTTPYILSSNTAATTIDATVVASTLTVRRKPASGASSGGLVVIADSATPQALVSVAVNTTGPGAGVCP